MTIQGVSVNNGNYYKVVCEVHQNKVTTENVTGNNNDFIIDENCDSIKKVNEQLLKIIPLDYVKSKGKYVNKGNYCVPKVRIAKNNSKLENEKLKFFNQVINKIAHSSKPLIERYKECVTNLKELIANKISPDNATFNPICNMFIRNNDSKNAMLIFKTMKKKFGIKPNKNDYTSIIQMHNRCGSTEMVIETFKKMLKDEIQPDVITFNNVLFTFVKTKDENKFLHYANLMNHMSVKPNNKTCDLWINHCVDHRIYLEAANLLSFIHKKDQYIVDGSLNVTQMSRGAAFMAFCNFLHNWKGDEFVIEVGNSPNRVPVTEYLEKNILREFPQFTCNLDRESGLIYVQLQH